MKKSIYVLGLFISLTSLSYSEISYEESGVTKRNQHSIKMSVQDNYFEETQNKIAALPKKEFLNESKNDSFFTRCKEGFQNFFQTPFGKQLGASELNNSIKDRIIDSEKNVWTQKKEGSTAYYESCVKSNDETKKTIITQAAQDFDFSKLSTLSQKDQNLIAGNACHDIKTVLNNVIEDNKAETLTVLTPVAQTNSYLFGLARRNHWTTLETNIEKGKVVSATLLDSKGIVSSLYGGAKKVQNLLPEGSPKVQTVYTGHQGVFNNSDCGRFTATYIADLAKGDKPQEIAQKSTKSFWSRFF